MKKGLVALLVIGIMLLIVGGIMFGVSFSKAKIHTTQIDRTENVDAEFTNININTTITDVEFKVSEDSKVKVVLKEAEKLAHEVKVENDTLNVIQKDTREWYEKIFSFNLGFMKAVIYLPAKAYGDLKIDSSTGDIRIPHDFSFNSIDIDLSTGDTYISSNVSNTLKIDASTGDTNLSNMSAKNIDIKASTGHVFLNDVTVSETIKLDLSTGRTQFENVTAKNYIHDSSTGRVILKNVIVEEEMDIDTSTGDIKFEDCDAQRITIEVGTGDVTGTLLSPKIFQVRTDTGKVNVPTSTTGGLCKIDTDTGNVSIKIK